MVARIHAIVRRSKGHAQSVVQTDDLIVKLDAKTAQINGVHVHLTGKEYRMLELLSLRKGTTITNEMFLAQLYGGMDEPEIKIIDVFICKLRKKLGSASNGKNYIETAVTPNRKMVIWNSRFVRIAVGIILLVGAVVAILPRLTGYTSLAGTVNARITIVSAPISGTVTATPPKNGTSLPVGAQLFGIRNDGIARTAEVQYEAELTGAKGRLVAIKNQRAQLSLLQQELQGRWHEYQQASIQNLTRDIAVRRQRIVSAAAQQEAAEADLVRKERLRSSGIVAQVSVEQARATSVTAQNEGRISNMELERLSQQLVDVKRGIFTGEGRNDVPYSQQRIDELTIQLAELQFRERDLNARIVQLETQFEQERTRNRGLRYVIVKMPFEGVIWRNNVVEGTSVFAGNEILQVLDCRDLFVDILVSEVDYDEIYPGRDAQIRLLGRSDALQGQVLSARGSAAVVKDEVLAAKLPQSSSRDARIRVGIPESALQTDYANFCQVGRSAQVRFRTRSFPIIRWFYALWFSIT